MSRLDCGIFSSTGILRENARNSASSRRKASLFSKCTPMAGKCQNQAEEKQERRERSHFLAPFEDQETLYLALTLLDEQARAAEQARRTISTDSPIQWSAGTSVPSGRGPSGLYWMIDPLET